MGLFLKYLLGDCRISQAEVGKAVGFGKSTMSLVCNAHFDRFPSDEKKFKRDVEKFLSAREEVREYLAKRGMKVSDVWNTIRNGKPVRTGGPRKETLEKMKGRRAEAAAAAAGGSKEIEISMEVEMLTQAARTAWKMFRDPFQHEIDGTQDIFMSEETRYMFLAMKDAALNGGFMGIVGEVGSGKSTARKWLETELARDENVRIISARSVDKSRLTDASIMDAIVFDLSHEAPKQGPEKKSRQVRKLLLNSAKEGIKVVLIIEEAQDLTLKAFKVLKRLYEIEAGFQKTMGIILIGQTELGMLLNEREHPEMREVIMRCQVARIQGLNGSIAEYLDHKFSRAKIERQRVITDKAIEALAERLKSRDPRGRAVSHAYPLTVNNQVTRAMNHAADIGEKVVTEEVINAL